MAAPLQVIGRPIGAYSDTSGSIGPLELEQFAGEISAISEEAQPEAIHAEWFDESSWAGAGFRR